MHPLVGECTIPVQARILAVGWHEPVNLPAAFTVYKPGESPHRFTGGRIDRVAIDVSGEPYLDLEREAALMLMRE